jgi:hypothetical protein
VRDRRGALRVEREVNDGIPQARLPELR